MNFKFYISAAVLGIQLFIHEANTYDNLQYWGDENKYEARRHEEKASQTKRSPDFVPIVMHVSQTDERDSQENSDYIKNKASTRIPKRRQEAAKPEDLEVEARVKDTISFKSNDDDEQETRISSYSLPLVLEAPHRRSPPSSKKDHQKKNRPCLLPDSSRSGCVGTGVTIAVALKDLISKMPEANVTVEIIGRTAEFNDIVLLKAAKPATEPVFRADDNKFIDEVPEKKIIFIVHGLSVMGVDKLSVFKNSTSYSKLFSYYFEHLDKFDIFILPMANPDGYAFAMNHEGKSYWNKNISPQNECSGVNLDRNFDVEWKPIPISSCSQQYPGPSPFSEPETRAIREVFHRYGLKIFAYMNMHSAGYEVDSYKGDAVLYPNGYTDAHSNDDKYIDLKGDIDEAMKNATFKYTGVTVDTIYKWYGKVLGTSVDYASKVYAIPFAMELVMQVYPGRDLTSDNEEEVEDIALREIWGRIINVIFKSFWKNMHMNDIQ